jgi:tetratricopeptide (TPR) repeat protein
MHTRTIRIIASRVDHTGRGPAAVLLAVLATTILPGSMALATTLSASPDTPPDATPSYNNWLDSGDGTTHEYYNLPEDVWRYGYRQGLQDGYRAQQNDDDTNNRTQKLLRTRDDALKAGLQAFHQGSYDQAADLFVLGGELDHGDPACRLYAAQALFAVGQYDQALPLLRRAFDLQPNLLYLRFDLRAEYGNPADMTSQVAILQTFMMNNPDWADGYLLLGYEWLHSGQRNMAYQAFKHAVQLDPVDALSRRLLRLSYPVAAAAGPQASRTGPDASTAGKPPASPRIAPSSPTVPATPAARVTSLPRTKA